MELGRNSNIKVYTRATRGMNEGTPCTPSTRILTLSDSEDELDTTKSHHQMTYRIEDDLNWASKYLTSDRASSTPKVLLANTRFVASSTEDIKAISSVPGKHPGSLHSDDSGMFGSHNSVTGQRSKSPSTFSDNSEDDFVRVAKKQSDFGATPSFRRSIAYPVTCSTAMRNRLNGMERSVRSSSVSPNISLPVTRTYEDLSRPRTRTSKVFEASRSFGRTFEDSKPAARSIPTFENPRPETRTYGGFERSRPVTTSVAAGLSRPVVGSDLESKSFGGNSRSKRPVSETRKRIRNIICRSRNDPHYFDDDV